MGLRHQRAGGEAGQHVGGGEARVGSETHPAHKGSSPQPLRATRSPPPRSPSRPSTNFDALSTFIASRRPIFICPVSNAASVPRRAEAAQYRTASGPCSCKQPGGRDDVAHGLGHLLAVGVEDPTGDRRVLPRELAELEVRTDHGGEQPRADDVLALGTQVHGEGLVEQPRVVAPLARDLRGERRRGPRVHDVLLADEAAGHVALRLGVARERPGTTGRRAGPPRTGRMGESHTGSPAASSGYHTGIGTPKKRWREMSQSPWSPLTQFS